MFCVKKVSLYVAGGFFLMLAVSCVSAEDSKEAVEKKTSSDAPNEGEREFTLEKEHLDLIKQAPDPCEQNKRLGKGINLGNALDGPNEGDWGVTLKEEYFKIIKDAGFDSVRTPCRWSGHALKEKPYTIDPNFFSRVDWAIKNAIKNNLYVVLNIHHYLEMNSDPNGNSERFLGLWQQIAEHYKDYPDSVLFEPLNEPSEKLTAELWNVLLRKALAVVRKSNPHRTIVIEPAGGGSIYSLRRLNIPEQDRNIIISIHYYEPSQFTHQGAPWVSGSDAWLGRKWTGEDNQKQEIKQNFKKAAGWAKGCNRPVNLGEFGVYEKADMASRAAWTAFVAKTAMENGWSFHYWEFCHTNFGAYDQQTNAWKEPLLKALIQPDK